MINRKKWIMNKILIVLISCIFIIPSIVNAKDLRSDILLYDGLYGEDVKLLQEKLNLVSSCGLKIDGIFGPLTDSCVRKFQEAYGLKVDGIVGYYTINKLNELTIDNYVDNKYIDSSSFTIPEYVMINTNTLNVRDDAGANSKVIDKVRNGYVYAVYGSKKIDDKYWYRINVNNKFGYVNSRYVNDTFIIISKNNSKLSYYKNGALLYSTYVGIKENTKKGCYNLYLKDIYSDRNILNKIVGMDSNDIDKINNYIDSNIKVVVRN